jgi:hypothetical protein
MSTAVSSNPPLIPSREAVIDRRLPATIVVQRGLRTPTGPSFGNCSTAFVRALVFPIPIHAAIDKPGGVVFRCDTVSSDSDCWLEIPASMFDRSSCVKCTPPFISRLSSDPGFLCLASEICNTASTYLRVRCSSRSLPCFTIPRDVAHCARFANSSSAALLLVLVRRKAGAFLEGAYVAAPDTNKTI